MAAVKKKIKKTVKKTPKKTVALKKQKKPSGKKGAGVKAKSAAAKKPHANRVFFKKEMLKNLIDSRRRLLEEVSQKVRQESNVLKFEIGDIYDIASNERERELTLTLGDREREKLHEIDRAIERLNDKDYGICEECGEPVGEERLKALPFTRVCVDCKMRSEKEARVKIRAEEESVFGITEGSEGEEEEY